MISTQIPNYGIRQAKLYIETTVESFKHWLDSHPLVAAEESNLDEGSGLRIISPLHIGYDWPEFAMWSNIMQVRSGSKPEFAGNPISYTVRQVTPTRRVAGYL